jgi:hypothetical protein
MRIPARSKEKERFTDQVPKACYFLKKSHLMALTSVKRTFYQKRNESKCKHVGLISFHEKLEKPLSNLF